MDIKPYSKRIKCNYHPEESKQYQKDIYYCDKRACVECLFHDHILPMSWRHRMFNRVLEIEPWN